MFAIMNISHHTAPAHNYEHLPDRPPLRPLGAWREQEKHSNKPCKTTASAPLSDHWRLAVTMGIARSTVHYWFNETQDPQADAIPAIVAALEAIEPAAARAFLEAYLGRSLTDWITPDPP